jgi:hypothetical protein
VDPPRQLKVCVELGPPEEPIRGEVAAPSGERTAFSGWIGLVAAIEAARMPTPVEGQPIAGGEARPERASDQDGRASGAGRELGR